MFPTVARLSKASRKPLTTKRGNKDYYKGTRQAFLPGGHRTGAPGVHVVRGKAKYRLLDEKYLFDGVAVHLTQSNARLSPSMSAKPFAVFPPEIRDEIIDRVLDTVTIKSCTLVCHDWLPRARTNLFRNFTFPPNARSEPQQKDLSEYKEKLELLAEDMASSSISPPYSRIVRILTVRLPLLISRENLAFNTLISQLPFYQSAEPRLFFAKFGFDILTPFAGEESSP
ncbi:hypothetical protein D9758_003617 [Tetrapyrgos nigripes]|uniref:F-box domain-containing protein n=1 Tax=Tetrapyrgos nigripes TaxID=182062 RepID=A0A8H5LS61_9AGAR|nr:hypothetical protein D9758_003617 [Tetrapyrgos nigripes]